MKKTGDCCFFKFLWLSVGRAARPGAWGLVSAISNSVPRGLTCDVTLIDKLLLAFFRVVRKHLGGPWGSDFAPAFVT